MLSHHEFATLVLLNDSAESTELDLADVEALRAQQLVALEHWGQDQTRARVTTRGYALLQAFGRVPARDCRARPASR
ncbi:hypothetical protein E5S69_25115 [Cupriavidus necator]|uniref:hypothetical protein n=1 Tax=Cupriavidus necator TaxID=106590 RepID=UPI00148FC2DE|nr:hypothetical protein [Cupriavidus necator]